ncbi:MarR family winged helix-turn-helix transcriptional regulator, partial [Nocardia asiatica]|uniref:MarR family winged helix-turn-helix transcriptional regulator n=1 Tax=Nocardia asiatica TaxID=209252 RepID=UPI0005B903AF
AHYAVFRYLDPNGSRITELAEAAGMTQQSMGELVTHLERRGLVVRQVDPADRRARTVLLTEAGRAALEVAAERIRDIERTVEHAVGQRTLAELRATLGQVGAALTERVHGG